MRPGCLEQSARVQHLDMQCVGMCAGERATWRSSINIRVSGARESLAVQGPVCAMLRGLATFVFLSPSLRAVLGNPVRMFTLSHDALQGGNKLQRSDKEEVLTMQSPLAAGNALCTNALHFYGHLFLACYYLLALLR